MNSMLRAFSALLLAFGIAVSGTAFGQNVGSMMSLLAGQTQTKGAPPTLKKLLIKDRVVGKGEPVKAGDRVYITYNGTLANGRMFDSNDSKDTAPYSFEALAKPAQVIKGMELGVVGMKIGGKRLVSIPAAMGYGKNGSEGIPPNADLYFEITLLDVLKKGEENIYDQEDPKIGTGPAVKKGDTIVVHYVGTFVNGKAFDKTQAPNRGPVEFKVGVGRALRGVDVGVVGMKVGGIRRLRIPPNLAYGVSDTGIIPPYSILKYEITLVKIKR